MSLFTKRDAGPVDPALPIDELVARLPVSLRNTQEAALRAQAEAERHLCPMLRELLELAKAQAEQLARLETCVRVLAGQLERWELHQVATDPHYPLRQDRIDDLEARRAELERRIAGPAATLRQNGATDHAR